MLIILFCLYPSQVLEVVANLQGRDLFEMSERVYTNSINLFSF